MRTIQEVGGEILNKTPSKFYVFTGSEYGIKCKYLDILAELYTTVKEVATVQEILNTMHVKHIVPLPPALYIVRYDESFLALLDSTTQNKIDNTDIRGTIVCIYDTFTKNATKLEKYLSKYTVSIDKVDHNFVVKYLHSDFPNLPDRLIDIAAKIGSDYADSQHICHALSSVPLDKIFALSDIQIAALFGKQQISTEAQIRTYIAARNYTQLIHLIDTSDNIDSIFYTICATLIEIEKLLGNKYTQSDIREYVNRWTYKDVYNMFMNTYEELKKLRSYATDPHASLSYVVSLLKFSEIPSVEDML